MTENYQTEIPIVFKFYFCTICNKAFIKRKTKSKNGRPPKYCSNECRAKGRKPAVGEKTDRCSRCNKTIYRVRKPSRSKTPVQRTCKDCRKAKPVPYGPRRQPTKPYGSKPESFESRKCKYCKRSFTVRKCVPKNYCNQSCAMSYRNLTRRLPPEEKLRRQRARDRLKSRKFEGPTKDYTTYEIAKRDNFTCQLCGRPVNMKLPWPQPLSQSIDHIIPRTKGGHDVESNEQLAHLICNTRKGITTDSKVIVQRIQKVTLTTDDTS